MSNSILFAREHSPTTLRRLVQRARLSRVAPGVHTQEVDDIVGAVARNWLAIVRHLMSDAVITNSSAAAAGAAATQVRPAKTIGDASMKPMFPIVLSIPEHWHGSC